MKKNTKFKLIAISLPLILILLIELSLRISGYGTSYNLFNELKIENQPDYLVMNSDIGKKYFRNMDFSSDNREDLFLKTKTDSTFRIFVQGASSVVGFPFYNGGSFPNMLKHRLSQTFPEKNIEVINTGITAVNSFTLLDFTDEIIDQKPDLVIIYAGHNEYYGALGVGSTSYFGSHPSLARLYLSAKNLRLFQLLENTYSKLITKKTNPDNTKMTGMEEMARQQSIPYGSKIYQAGIDQFEGNLERILDKYKRNKIPVIISTIVCNEKNIKPFINEKIDTVQFLNEIKRNDPKVNIQAGHNAMAAYLLGQHYLSVNNDSAKKYLHLARELDLLRFRAPEEINDVIVKLAHNHDCHLVNMKDLFLKHSGQRIIGDELLAEHVHPNVEGYFVMADAFYNKIKELNLISRRWDNYISFKEAINDIPITPVDSIYGRMIIDNLKKSWPFVLSRAGARYETQYSLTPDLSFEEYEARTLFRKMTTRIQIMKDSYKWYKSKGDYRHCLRVIQSDILDFPEWTELNSMAGDICLKLNDTKKAVYYFYKFNQIEKSSLSAQLLANAYIKNNQTEMARKTLLEAKKNGLKDEVHDKILDNINQTLKQ